MGRVNQPLPIVAGGTFFIAMTGDTVAIAGAANEVPLEPADLSRGWGRWLDGVDDLAAIEPAGAYRITVDANLEIVEPPAAPTTLYFEGPGLGLTVAVHEETVGPDHTRLHLSVSRVDASTNIVPLVVWKVATDAEPGLGYVLGVFVVLEYLGPG